MNQKSLDKEYKIGLWQDDIYVVYPKNGNIDDYLFKGTLPEVNAWLSLKQKGFDL